MQGRKIYPATEEPGVKRSSAQNLINDQLGGIFLILYHGSNVDVRNPKILVTNRMLDFGPGFYTTSNVEQAKRWAELQAHRRMKGIPTVSMYAYDEDAVKKLSLLCFQKADGDWLNFVAQNRRGIYRGPKFDIVIGPVANDNTMTVISDYMAGTINKDTALILLLPQKLADQYAFLTAKGLSALKYMGVKFHG